MFSDVNDNLSENQAITADAASTNVRDLGIAIPGDVGSIRVKAVVTTDFASNVDIRVALQDSADNSSFTTKVEGEQIARANLTVGKVVLDETIPRSDLRRYVRGWYDVNTSATAGKISMTLSPAVG